MKRLVLHVEYKKHHRDGQCSDELPYRAGLQLSLGLGLKFGLELLYRAGLQEKDCHREREFSAHFDGFPVEKPRLESLEYEPIPVIYLLLASDLRVRVRSGMKNAAEFDIVEWLLRLGLRSC